MRFGIARLLIAVSITLLPLAFGACSPSDTSPVPAYPPAAVPAVIPSPVSNTVVPGQAVTLTLSAQGFAFDSSSLSVTAGVSVTIRFVNKDNAPHNFSLYDSAALQKNLFKGEFITGPNATIEYKFTAPAIPGTYYFRCDSHPNMKGNLLVS
jgi:plastocyanin